MSGTALIVAIIYGIACFVAGALVYRNNAKRAEELAGKLQKEVDELRAKVKK